MYFLDQYLYTTEETLEDFGPLLKMESLNDFCVSLYLKQCDNCKIKFFLKQKNTTSVLKEVYNVRSRCKYFCIYKYFTYSISRPVLNGFMSY